MNNDSNQGDGIAGEFIKKARDGIFSEVFSDMFGPPASWNCIRCKEQNSTSDRFCKCGAPIEWSVKTKP